MTCWHVSRIAGDMTTSFAQRAAVAARSAGVGSVATLVDLVVLCALVSGLGVPARFASVPALALGVLVQFAGNKLFAFRDRSRAWLRQGAQFLAVESLGFVLNLSLFDALVTRTQLPYLCARVVTTLVVYYAVCLPLWSRIFACEAPEAATEGVSS